MTLAPTPETKLLPFHEVVITAIAQANPDQMQFLATLLRNTKIPKNRGSIIAVWNQRMRDLGWTNDLGVPAALFAQRDPIEAKATEEKPPRDIDDNDISALSGQVLVMMRLLNDVQTDSSAWQVSIREALEEMSGVVSKALGK